MVEPIPAVSDNGGRPEARQALPGGNRWHRWPHLASHHVRALVFDVFGTVVDWRSSVIFEGEALTRTHGVAVDWGAFADEWRRDGYLAGIARVRSGEWPWMRVDAIHRRKLNELLPKYGLTALKKVEITELNHVWHRLTPWPDSVPGLLRLRRRYTIAPLSNGDLSLLTNMAKRAGLPWDCILAAELFGHYKRDPEVYLGAARLLDLRPDEVMLVAAHVGDLLGARACGLRTAYVFRPLEFGPDTAREAQPDPPFDIVARDFADLADRLEA